MINGKDDVNLGSKFCSVAWSAAKRALQYIFSEIELFSSLSITVVKNEEKN